MRKAIYSFIYYRLLGWKMNVIVPEYDKCVVCTAPHTTNLDLFIGRLFYGAMGGRTSFAMRKEWSFFLLGLLFGAVGGIPVNRSRKTSLVERMTYHSSTSKRFHLAITPEGTRKRNPNWKKSFYYTALKAQIPTVLVGIGYTTKTITSTRAVMPSGDIDKDMRKIKLYFRDFKGKHPENFLIGDVEWFMKISTVQIDIIWEDKQENLRLLREKLLPLRGATEIVVLPEMFTMESSMNNRTLAEPISGFTIRTLKGYAAESQFALVGSFIYEEAGAHYNQAFLITPDGQEFYYDKRHLFRMGCETEHFLVGNRRAIVPYRSWNICLQICYDFRSSVQSRNINSEYDLLIYIASWPTPRIHAQNTLFYAHAIENQCYVCGVSHTGRDGSGLHYPGYSALYSPKGEILTGTPDSGEKIQTIELDIETLTAFRHKFSS